MDKAMFEYKRKSYIELGEIYFWTATINKWQRLLSEDTFKDVITDSLQYLSNAEKADVFAFVIMPNHMHVIWRINKGNGKETTQAAFLKYTAHEFKKILSREHPELLSSYAIAAQNKNYEFWQRDSLAIHLRTKEVALQKLSYLHYNPCTEHWQLAKEPCDYAWSSAGYYETGEKRFAFLKDLWQEF